MEARQRSISIEDIYKRRLQRSKVKDVEKPFHIPIQDKSAKWKFHHLKLVLAIIIFCTFITILYSPTTHHHDHISQAVSRWRWIWGASDPQYTSDLDINWNEISRVIRTISGKNNFQGIGILNFNKSEIDHWKELIPKAEHIFLHLDHVQRKVTWDSLYPEWIDEEEEEEIPVCPTLPKVQVPRIRKRLDLIVIKLPCRDEGNWSRDVARLHVQLAAAQLAIAPVSAKANNHPLHLLFVTKGFPIPNLFICKELVLREGNTWLYKPNLNALREKLQLPVGSCQLALPLKPNKVVEAEKQEVESERKVHHHREAYATILHSAHVYVCGAIVAAQSIRMAGSTRDLIILVDDTISEYHRSGLEAAGWKIRTIQRIRNPKAEKDAYNEWNYSKFRLWQLTDYDKIIFIDADMLILRNIDFLFRMPEISATGNNGTLFNSGVMVIEPSDCTFKLLIDHINEIESYNGGDQGYLNEIFTWWHRIPKHMNYLKNFWVGDDEAVKQKKTKLFGAEPPILYVLHYLGLKPWLCFRDYDCNWNVDIFHEFASDVAHNKWWRVHDAMPQKLQQFCLLKSKQKAQLEWNRMQAEKENYTDGHWRNQIKDWRLNKCIDNFCSWESMLRHWGETNWTDDEFFNPSPPAITMTSLSGL
ncbi:UDP-glucuronate:xylan alpha-glucuronosyltransferase 1-like isoform X1 [Camellia sinensis]|uniref:UDP-glucuronate:xylan alpha-glucuronosyltransferase 1-like isoform X1 n=1 Tax=Camellia sinensis TaxID=4442 RepID=UPI00103607E0|nr:UDP-glucuronate:xylan alpha-glucuronosyltransferase 1-like isoform X1 [Camellia sinensis]XP_028088165.1 UDP-glucuronate:xylan alpha-glucuronosyltransferase 1-like isoform X1 [Camellia sinensis]XP_028088166.1 UDP-glucuronate:xylan alpha-glucuronosyltransferase 1-like isoform X1 [Camellia sinensis]